MPTYEYACSKCGEHIEVHQTFDEPPLTRHGGCGGKLTKVLAPVGVVLKGSGFYKTDSSDSARSRSKARSESKSSESKSSGSDSSGNGSSGSSVSGKSKKKDSTGSKGSS